MNEMIFRMTRQERGHLLSRSARIKNLAPGKWLVPSQTNEGAYLVDTDAITCSCPDHELRTIKCKHMWAVSYARHEVLEADGSKTSVETLRISYKQNWPAYNAAQCQEKERVRILLRALCEGVQNPVQKGRGRQRLPLADVIYAAGMKVYSGFSGRRATTEINDCQAMGFIDKTPSYNALFDYLAMPTLTPVLSTLIQESAAPLAEIDHESQFGIDGTGFSTCTYRRWFDHKYGKEMKEAKWVKLHVITGVRSNIVTSAVATDGTLHDSPQLPNLVDLTAERFKMKEVLADKAYLANSNLDAIAKVGADAYIPFKSNSQGEGAELWRKMWHVYSFHRDEFLRHYHQRSNVEATFSAIKRKFGGSVRSKLLPAQINEALLKTLVYNLSVLVHTTHELGIDPLFWKPREGSPS